jgi:transcriptional activator SPT7
VTRCGILNLNLHSSAKPTEPPPPYPPPPPFVPITSKNVEDQIGLLRAYYQERLATLAPSVSAPQPILGMPLIPAPFGVPSLGPTNVAGAASGPTLLTLLDDSPPTSQTKLGPIGQVVKSGQSTGAVKKKAKATGPPPKAMGGGAMLPLPPGLLTLKPEDVPMEPLPTPFEADVMRDGHGDGLRRVGTAKGVLSGGNGNGAKKKAVDLPPVIAASA